MAKNAHFQVDPRLARLLGETYRSSEAALKELVDNAWDAEAANVWVLFPEPMTTQPVIISDDGNGMTEEAVREEYLNIARDKRVRTGDVTPKLGRKVKGRKGVGKFSGLTIAQVMILETRTDLHKCTLRIDKQELTEGDVDLEEIPLPLEVATGNFDVGTEIRLEHLDQNLTFPDPDKFREMIVREYGREDGFSVFVDGTLVGFGDLKGTRSTEKHSINDDGDVALDFVITEDKSKPKSPGISLRVGGKVVGKPSFFGLETDEEIPPKLLKNLTGEIDVPESPGLVTADWGGVNESNKSYQEIERLVRDEVKASLQETHKNQMQLQRARLQKAINERLKRLPENRRGFAEVSLGRILSKFYGESDERIKVIIEVALDAMELDGYWTVLDKINAASNRDVEDFANSLQDFGLLELSNVGRQAQSRRQFLGHLEQLALTPATKEVEMHTALEGSLWVFGQSYSMMSSNQTLKTIVSTYADKEFTGPRKDHRPDLLLAHDPSGRHLLIEFKRPSKIIGRPEIGQAEAYREDLQKFIGSAHSVEVLVVGKSKQDSVLTHQLSPGVTVTSYLSAFADARSQIDWLLEQLAKG